MELKEFNLLFLIPLLPLVGAAYNAILGPRLQRRFGHAAVHWPAALMPFASFGVALWAFLTLAGEGPEAALYQHAWSWLKIGALNADVAFLMDRLSGVMALVVTGVGSLIHVYSIGYMHDEPSYWRFFSYLNLFMFAMLTLVLGDNFLLMFVGWEGVGLCSYLLISFWYQDREKASAGMKAFVVNRVGDFGFSLGLFLLFWGLASATRDASTAITFRGVEALLSDEAVRAQFLAATVGGLPLVTVACLLLFVGATGKSAQIPLYVWLPDAMAGPTPVSALIHAATMVTAGVYLVARLHFLFALTPVAMTVITVVGALTAFFAATIGLFQYDIKKVLAYSTVSQLGFMFVAVGVGAWWVGIFHLVTHAFFKACLFLGSGSVIMGCHHEQDMRKMGGLRKLMPVTAATYFVSCAAIAGFPFFSGFFSKDEILWKVFDSGMTLLPGGGAIPWAVAATAALATSFYMFRSYYMTFSGEYRGNAGTAGGHGHVDVDDHVDDHDHDHDQVHGHAGHAHVPHESPATVTVVLSILGFLAVFGGFMGLPMLWGLPNFFEHWLEPVFEGSKELVKSAGHGHAFEWGLMGLSIVIAFGGFFLARALYRDSKSAVPARLLASPSPVLRFVHRVVFNKYYVDEAYQATVIDGSLGLSRALSWWDARIVDGIVNLVGAIGRVFARIQGLIDTYLVDGIVNRVAEAIALGGRVLRVAQTGRIQSYVYGLAAGSLVLVVATYLIAG